MSINEKHASYCSKFVLQLFTDPIWLQVVGWRIANEDGVLKLQCTWKLKDFDCGVELINRIGKVVEGTGHLPTLHQLQQSNQVHAELWTPSIGEYASSVTPFL